MARYAGDPRWIHARFDSKAACGHAVKKGERVFYYPRSKSIFCPKCSEEKSQQFEAERFDEDMLGG